MVIKTWPQSYSLKYIETAWSPSVAIKVIQARVIANGSFVLILLGDSQLKKEAAEERSL